MLHDSQTDLVFIPMAIRYHFPRFYKSLIAAFREARIKCWELPYTSEKTRLWARDYMPITVDGKGDGNPFACKPDGFGEDFAVACRHAVFFVHV